MSNLLTELEAALSKINTATRSVNEAKKLLENIGLKRGDINIGYLENVSEGLRERSADLMKRKERAEADLSEILNKP